MLYVALTLAVIIALLAVLATVTVRSVVEVNRRLHEAMRIEREAWRAERAELLNRIQHPEYLPLPPTAEPRDVVPPHVDEFERVGSITYGEPLEDEDRG